MRDAISTKDTEGILGAISRLMKNIDDNWDLLRAKGFKDALYDKIISLRDAIDEDNNKQNLLTDERNAQVEKKHGLS